MTGVIDFTVEVTTVGQFKKLMEYEHFAKAFRAWTEQAPYGYVEIMLGLTLGTRVCTFRRRDEVTVEFKILAVATKAVVYEYCHVVG